VSSLRILGLCGSLSQRSLNRMALLAWSQRLGPDVAFETAEIGDLPHYNADLQEPSVVTAFKEGIALVDAVLIATPEYNYGIPGVLKNALDWASRPAYKSVFANKPVSLLGASPGPVGTVRAQGQLKQVLLGMLSDIYPCPELAINLAAGKFDQAGLVIDEALNTALTRHAQQFASWVRHRKQAAT